MYRCRTYAPQDACSPTHLRTVRNMASSFNDLELLTQEALIVKTLRTILDTYKELKRREDINAKFLKTFCGLNEDTWLWYVLWEAGSAQRYTDILSITRFTRPRLSRFLQKLLKAGLIRKIGMRYQAIVPPSLVTFSLLNGDKS